MNPEGFRATLERLRLDQAELARIIDASPVTVWRWTRGERETPGAVVALLDLMEGIGVNKARRVLASQRAWREFTQSVLPPSLRSGARRKQET
jgi:transcriptional regulator with XRE-family HTH domain